MAFINSNGKLISYECSDLIEELNDDIAEFGGDTFVNVWCKKLESVTVYTNYDFIDQNDPVQDGELLENEHIRQMSMTALLLLLEKQNEIL